MSEGRVFRDFSLQRSALIYLIIFPKYGPHG